MLGDDVLTPDNMLQRTPRWFVRFALRVAQLERGRAYNVLIVVPHGGGEPVWTVLGDGKLENQRG